MTVIVHLKNGEAAVFPNAIADDSIPGYVIIYRGEKSGPMRSNIGQFQLSEIAGWNYLAED